MTRRSWLALPAWLPLLACASAPPAPPAPPKIDARVEELMRRAEVPGLALALIRDGQIVHQRAYGFADLETQRPLTTDTVMYGASLTKAAFAYLKSIPPIRNRVPDYIPPKSK